jgi:hypothetical protein
VITESSVILLVPQHWGVIKPLISSGVAKITDARSPIIPEPTIAGVPFSGPSPLPIVVRLAVPRRDLVGFAAITNRPDPILRIEPL